MLTGEMKNIIKITLAIASTMFLAVGATRAAGKLDPLGSSNINTMSVTVMDPPPPPPCVIIVD